MYRILRQSLSLGLIGASLVVYQNCAKANFEATKDFSANIGAVTTTGPAVCDPFGNNSGGSNTQGLVGNLYYVPVADQSSSLLTMADVQAKALKANGTIYISQVNVPTRKFNTGFSGAGGSPLLDDMGNVLVEYFMLHLKTVFKLSSGDQPGYYQFATVSDDGMIMSTTSSGVERRLAGLSDQVHSTRSDCGTITVQLDGNSRLPLDVLYYQGPRDEIAAVMMYRRVSNPNSLDTNGCGISEGTTFFSSSQNSAYSKMQSAGWQIVPKANFELPSSAGTNPCVTN